MQGELVPHEAALALAIVNQQKDPQKVEEEQQARIAEAQALEEKLKVIQESVPTRVYNTCSSSAGAGSSDFHMYRMIRKAEQERWLRIEKTHAQEQEKKAFEAKRRQREEEAEAKTAKNRAKRLKKKAKGKAKSDAKGDGPGGGTGDEGPTSEDPGEKVPEQAELD